MSKGSSMLRAMVARSLSAAIRCRHHIARFRVLHGPGQRTPAALMRTALRPWHQLDAHEQASYNETEYQVERFGARGDVGAYWQSIFMERAPLSTDKGFARPTARNVRNMPAARQERDFNEARAQAQAGSTSHMNKHEKN